MAHDVTITKIVDGPRNAVFHVFIKGDGVSGDLSGFDLIDPLTSFDPSLPNKPLITLMELDYSLVGFNAYLAYDYLVPDTPLWALAGGNESHVCFEEFGGLKDRSNPLDGTGKLQLHTSGLDLATDFGSMIITVRKD